MGMTRELMGVNANPVWKKWIDEQTESEQPGIFWSIALAVLNLGAIIAAPFTGGLSLVVAAGVNAVAAVEHVKEYQMQKALAGTAFDKAHALSQDDPSFFWLAVEIVGVAVDAAPPSKPFRRRPRRTRLPRNSARPSVSPTPPLTSGKPQI
jgi:hypothetical protein